MSETKAQAFVTREDWREWCRRFQAAIAATVQSSDACREECRAQWEVDAEAREKELADEAAERRARMRDGLASASLTGIRASACYTAWTSAQCARLAYQDADAMLAVRGGDK